MKAVILAGGLGVRLNPLTKVFPKPLLPVGEKSILEITINRLSSFGFDDIIIATNYKTEMFENFKNSLKVKANIKISKEDKMLGTAGPLKLVKDELTEPFLVINGDILTDLDFKKLIENHKNKNASFTLVSKRISLPLHYGVVKHKDGRVMDLEEKPLVEEEINAGIYVLDPKVLEFIPDNESYHMTDLIKELIKNGYNVQKHTLTDYWLDIGMMKDYERANKDAKEGKLEWI